MIYDEYVILYINILYLLLYSFQTEVPNNVENAVENIF